MNFDIISKINSLGIWSMDLWFPLMSIAIFALFYFLGYLFDTFFYPIILKVTNKTKTSFDTKLAVAFRKPIRSFFVVWGLYMSLNRHIDPYSVEQAISLRILRSLIIILITSGFYNLTSTTSALFQKISEKLDLEIDQILIPVLSKTVRFIIVAISATIIAQEWGYDVNGFVAGLGIGGLAFALAAKDALANIFGGVVIIIDKPFSIGDWILTPSVEGTVEDINFRSTKVRTFAHALVTVPNSTLANNPITNWSKMGKRRISFNLGVTYTTPRAKLKQCVRRIELMLKSHNEIHPDTIFVRFDSFNDSSLDIFIFCFTNTTVWGEFLRVKEDVNFKIMEILEEEGVSVALPSRSIYFENNLTNKGVQL